VTYADGCSTSATVTVTHPSACNDGNACTIDTCSSSGCIYTPITCNDGNVCTADTCSGGNCVYTPIPGCSLCSTADCPTPSGCQSKNCIESIAGNLTSIAAAQTACNAITNYASGYSAADCLLSVSNGGAGGEAYCFLQDNCCNVIDCVGIFASSVSDLTIELDMEFCLDPHFNSGDLPCAIGVNATVNLGSTPVPLLPALNCTNTTGKTPSGGTFEFDNLVDIVRGSSHHPFTPYFALGDVLAFSNIPVSGSPESVITLQISTKTSCGAPACYLATVFGRSGTTFATGTLVFD